MADSPAREALGGLLRRHDPRGVQESLPREQEQNHQQAESGVPEDQPGDAQPAAVAGEQPGQHGGAERERHGEREDAEDDYQLAELGREPRDAGRRFLGALEADRSRSAAGSPAPRAAAGC